MVGMVLLAAVFTRHSSTGNHAEKVQILKEVLFTLACLIDVPFWPTFDSKYVLLSLCFDYILMLVVPLVCCIRMFDTVVMMAVLFVNTSIRGFLYFGWKEGVFDLMSNVFIPYLLITIVCYNEL